MKTTTTKTTTPKTTRPPSPFGTKTNKLFFYGFPNRGPLSTIRRNLINKNLNIRQMQNLLFEKYLCFVQLTILRGGLRAAEIGAGGRPRFYFHFYFLPPGKFSSKSITTAITAKTWKFTVFTRIQMSKSPSHWQFFSLWYWENTMMKNQQLYAENSAQIC